MSRRHRRRPGKWEEGRWSARRPKSTKGYTWRHVYCPFCNFSYYRDLRLPFNDPFEEIKKIIADEAAAREAVNDYSHPAHRGLVLGRAFEIKQELWQEHLRVCEEQAYLAAVQGHIVESYEAFQNLVEELEGNQAVFDYIDLNSTPF